MNLTEQEKSIKKIILIDVSNLFFRAFYAVPGHFTDRDGNPSNAIYGVASVIFGLLESEKPTHLFAARDLRGPTFRHEEIDGYKAGRPEMPQDLAVQLPRVFEFFENALGVPLLSQESFEADDLLATLAERFRGRPDCEVGILSADQDLFQVVGENVFVFCPQNGGKTRKMNPEAVIEKMGVPPHQVADYKALAGDSSDRLSGVPGIGPVGARKILGEWGTLENALENAEKITGKMGELLSEHREHAILTRRMATLHRDLPLQNFSEDSGKIDGMPPNLLNFLAHISSQNLMTRAKKVFAEKKITEDQESLF